jgi:hypothetical protein
MYPNEDLKKTAAGPEDPVDRKKVREEEPQVIDGPLATFSEVFSFAETFKTKLYLALGLFWAMVAGLAVPAPLIIYSKAMGDISAIAQEGLKPVVEIVYYMMVLGVISFVSVVLVVKYLWILTFESFIRL